MKSAGLILSGNQPFGAVILPLAVELAPCFWLIDNQQGPFNSEWISFDNKALLEAKHFDVPACRNTSSSCWRPFTFPRLSRYVYVDEWTYFFAMRCNEEDVPRRAEWVVQHIGVLTSDFFDRLNQMADLFLFHADGWWELYTFHEAWRRMFRDAFPECFERSWKKAGEPPVRR